VSPRDAPVRGAYRRWPHTTRLEEITFTDFLVFYGTPATGAAWVAPKKYIEKVGEDGFKRHPIGLGPTGSCA
jgi:hypothetical protein